MKGAVARNGLSGSVVSWHVDVARAVVERRRAEAVVPLQVSLAFIPFEDCCAVLQATWEADERGSGEERVGGLACAAHASPPFSRSRARAHAYSAQSPRACGCLERCAAATSSGGAGNPPCVFIQSRHVVPNRSRRSCRSRCRSRFYLAFLHPDPQRIVGCLRVFLGEQAALLDVRCWII